MGSTRDQSAITDIFSRRTLPVFSAFFFWSLGTGGLWLVRPLFAYEMGGTFFLVALISAASAMPRVVVGPITGHLADRFGRRPFVVIGAVLHIASSIGAFFVVTYWQYFVLELIAGTGIAAYVTSANVLMADATRTSTRGRVNSARQVSTRVGTLAGPIVAGLVATTFGLRWVFIFIALTKFIVILVAVFLIKETGGVSHQESRATFDRNQPRGFDSSMFRNRAFLSLIIGTVALGLVNGGTGVFRTLFPPHASLVAGIDEMQIGYLIALAGILGLMSSVPSGIAIDRFGRKGLILFGLGIIAIGTYMMGSTESLSSAVMAVMVFGFAEAIAQGSIQTYAMDQAPADKRGAFLGTWILFTNTGQIIGPLVIGTLADLYGFQIAFTTVTGILLFAAVAIALLAHRSESDSGMRRILDR